MKKEWKLLLVMVIAILSCGLTACGGDDEDNPTPPDQPTLIGTWYQYEDGIEIILILNENHTGSISMSGDLDLDTRANLTLKESFNWNSVDDSNSNHWLEVIHTKGDTILGTTSYSYLLAGNTLTISGLGVLTKR